MRPPLDVVIFDSGTFHVGEVHSQTFDFLTNRHVQLTSQLYGQDVTEAWEKCIGKRWSEDRASRHSVSPSPLFSWAARIGPKRCPGAVADGFMEMTCEWNCHRANSVRREGRRDEGQ